jgi:hypothetical protein
MEKRKTYQEFLPSVRNRILLMISLEKKSVEAEWFVGLTDSSEIPENSNEIFFCFSNADAIALRNHILETHSNFSEGANFGVNQENVYLIGKY